MWEKDEGSWSNGKINSDPEMDGLKEDPNEKRQGFPNGCDKDVPVSFRDTLSMELLQEAKRHLV